nr:MAG TPA: hypothetical protein [Caudoviricetes sp.]
MLILSLFQLFYCKVLPYFTSKNNLIIKIFVYFLYLKNTLTLINNIKFIFY